MTEEEDAEIVRLWNTGEFTYTTLAARYPGLSREAIAGKIARARAKGLITLSKGMPASIKRGRVDREIAKKAGAEPPPKRAKPTPKPKENKAVTTAPNYAPPVALVPGPKVDRKPPTPLVVVPAQPSEPFVQFTLEQVQERDSKVGRGCRWETGRDELTRYYCGKPIESHARWFCAEHTKRSIGHHTPQPLKNIMPADMARRVAPGRVR